MSNLTEAKNEEAILAAAVYADMFHHPLTSMEIWQWMFYQNADGTAVSLGEVTRLLSESKQLRAALEQQQGFYFLRGRSNLVAIRHRRVNANRRHWVRARRFAGALRCLPFVRMGALANRFSADMVDQDSDIDLFIVIEKGHLWLTRLLVTVMAQLMGIRRHGRLVAGRVCLSYYVTTQQLSLESTHVQPFDVDLSFFLALLTPLYNTRHSYQRVMMANQWIRRVMPNLTMVTPVAKFSVGDQPAATAKVGEWLLAGFFGRALEALARALQKRYMRIPKRVKKEAGQPASVVVNDIMLKFHEIDRRAHYAAIFTARLKKALSDS